MSLLFNIVLLKAFEMNKNYFYIQNGAFYYVVDLLAQLFRADGYLIIGNYMHRGAV